MTVVLSGFMGAGKSTIGRLLAEVLGVPFVDIDQEIELRTGRSIRAIFEEDGEERFRRLEHDVVRSVVAGEVAVVALGGGAIEHAGTRVALEGVVSIHLEVSYEKALQRVQHDPNRPMLLRADLREVYERRQLLYTETAVLSIATDARAPREIVHDLHRWLTSSHLGAPDGGGPTRSN